MKKVLLIALAMILAIGICGCGEKVETLEVPTTCPSYMSESTFLFASEVMEDIGEYEEGKYDADFTYWSLNLDKNSLSQLQLTDETEQAVNSVFVMALERYMLALHDGDDTKAKKIKNVMITIMGSESAEELLEYLEQPDIQDLLSLM